jgi:hypothetical protein
MNPDGEEGNIQTRDVKAVGEADKVSRAQLNGNCTPSKDRGVLIVSNTNKRIREGSVGNEAGAIRKHIH